MTTEETIENLKYLISEDCTDTQHDYIEEIQMAIAALEKQEQYAKAEAEGRLIVLPCKVGDTVWYLTGNNSTHSQHFSGVEDSICTGILIEDEKILIRLRYDWKGNHGSYGVFGKTVFTSREAAKAALREA